MKRLVSAVCAALLIFSPAFAQGQNTYMERARQVLETVPLIDGHNDLAWAIRTSPSAPRDVDAYDLTTRTPGHTDLERLAQGMLGAQFWSVYIPGEYADSGYARVQLEQIDIARRFIEQYPKRLAWALTPSDVWAAFGERKIGSVLGVEGGHAIENSLGALRAYFALGVRYMTLTHNVTTGWADAAMDGPRHGGLTPFGEEVVREMNRLGMLVDLSHASPETMSDALNVTEAPVIFSHSSARALADVARNVPDSILRRLPENGGVVMVTFVPAFISQQVLDWHAAQAQEQERLDTASPGDTAAVRAGMRVWLAANPQPHATLAQVADHIDHIRRVAGVDHVGIGGDFDGIDAVVVGLGDVSTYPALFAELARRGWKDEELRKLAGENVLRVWREAERVAGRLKRARPPSTRLIGADAR